MVVLLWKIAHTASVCLEIVYIDALEILVRKLLRVRGLDEQMTDRVSSWVPLSLHPLNQQIVDVDATHADLSCDDRCCFQAPQKRGALEDKVLHVCLFEKTKQVLAGASGLFTADPGQWRVPVHLDASELFFVVDVVSSLPMPDHKREAVLSWRPLLLWLCVI